jgi:putative transposase
MERRIIDLPNQPHFVTFSTYQRRRFLDPERTKDIVLEVLLSCLATHKAQCHGFVIMPDHVHAVLTVDSEARIATFLLAWKKTSSYRIKRFYTQELTRYYERCPEDCPVWQARYYDYNLEGDDKVNEKLEYMHNNPVAARLTLTALDWRWSSARFYEKGEAVGVPITTCR